MYNVINDLTQKKFLSQIISTKINGVKEKFYRVLLNTVLDLPGNL